MTLGFDRAEAGGGTCMHFERAAFPANPSEHALVERFLVDHLIDWMEQLLCVGKGAKLQIHVLQFDRRPALQAKRVNVPLLVADEFSSLGVVDSEIVAQRSWQFLLDTIGADIEARLNIRCEADAEIGMPAQRPALVVLAITVGSIARDSDPGVRAIGFPAE